MIGNVDPSSRFIADKQPPRCVWTAGIGNFRTDPGSYPCGRCQGGQNEPAWIGWTPLRWLSADSHLHDFTRLPGHDIDATSSELHCSTRHDCMWFGRFKAIERGSAHMLGLGDIAYSRHITHNYVQSPAAILSELSWEHWVQCCRQTSYNNYNMHLGTAYLQLSRVPLVGRAGIPAPLKQTWECLNCFLEFHSQAFWPHTNFAHFYHTAALDSHYDIIRAISMGFPLRCRPFCCSTFVSCLSGNLPRRDRLQCFCSHLGASPSSIQCCGPENLLNMLRGTPQLPDVA